MINKPGSGTYIFSVDAEKKVTDISSELYGIFFEDINRSADGGIYAEMVQNRSFECFTYKVFNPDSGENGASKGKKHTPLRYWYGDTDKAEPMNKGGLEEYFGTDSSKEGLYYIKVKDGAVLYNRGFGGENEKCGMSLKKGSRYNFSIFAKAESSAVISAALLTSEKEPVSESVSVNVEGGGKWKKYEAVICDTEKDCIGQLRISFSGECCVDMVSLFPEDVWGNSESDIPAAKANYRGNPNYRLRRDLMQTLYDMHPAFIRFPGGCISEGAYIWDNVYDWKDSVGDAAIRRENYNLWGYNMTLGLGYMEYFQIAEDLGAEPVPVMACGILCQARSDYVNPSGGKLREKYIRNFTDLIDFALSTDFENNKWAQMRRDMGHEAPFGLHYLGIGNENWGDEFYANFEIFHHEIKKYLHDHYPTYPLKIISTAGAQADDYSMKTAWNFYCGGYKGNGSLRFTDGEKSWIERTMPYRYKKHYLDTIVDEHYYRTNEYLLENADRYDYYQRGSFTNKDPEIRSGAMLPKVFVGEYASSDRNTLRGAVAEAAVMTGFERNADIVKMASTAPLFNQPMDDDTFRWVPDCIWFDKDHVFRTPTYFVQQMFMTNTGKKLLRTRKYSAEEGNVTEYRLCGGFSVSASGGRVKFGTLNVETKSGDVYKYDFSALCAGEKNVQAVLEKCGLFCSDISAVSIDTSGFGLILNGTDKTVYLYSDKWELSEYKVTATALKVDSYAVIEIGAGLRRISVNSDMSEITVTKYCVGDNVDGTGLKVVKSGKEGYTMGDYACSAYAGNLRGYYKENVPVNTEVCAVLDYGKSGSSELKTFYYYPRISADDLKGEINCRPEAQIPYIYEAASGDNEYVYVKLVNADNADKNVRIDITGAKVSNDAELTVLTAELKDCDTENINTLGIEKVLPVKSALSGSGNGQFEMQLSAQSVNILKVKLV